MPTHEAELAGWVAAAINDKPTFQERAKQAAAQLDATQIKKLVKYFIYPNNPPKPAEVENQYSRLGEWQSMSQWAIFEIFYNRPDDTLPIIRDIAFGEYDWTQMSAIHTLCRLANEGKIEREKTIDEIIAFLPQMRDTASEYTINTLSLFVPTSPRIVELITGLIDEGLEWEPDVNLITSLARIAPEAARTYRQPLYDVMNGKYESKPDQPASYNQLQAAITLSLLYPEDQTPIKFIAHWAAHHPNDERRGFIRLAIDETPHLKKFFNETKDI
ncbi:MAG: hypothetical protein ABI690_21790 [Chloroflexota bacterium]